MRTRRHAIFALSTLISTPVVLAQEGPSHARMAGLVEEFDRELPDLQGFVALQRGEPLISFYRSGSSAGELRDIQSCTKAVLSMLVGIAVERGAIASLDQPVLAVLGDKVDAARVSQPTLTVRHLLTMTSGFELSGRVSRRQSDDPQFLMSRPVRAAPGTSFLYDNLSATLLSTALHAE